MNEIKETLVAVVYEMAKEDSYRKPVKADGTNFEWVHWCSEDGLLDLLTVRLDFENNDFFYDGMWCGRYPIESDDIEEFILRVLCVGRNYRHLSPELVNKLKDYAVNGMRVWKITYGRYNYETHSRQTKYISARTMEEAIKKARVKTLQEIDLVPATMK